MLVGGNNAFGCGGEGGRLDPFVNLASGVSFNMETVSFDILGPFGWPGRRRLYGLPPEMEF